METAVEFENYGFAIDLSGEEIEALDIDLHALRNVESPLASIEDAWDDQEIRERYPEEIEQIGDYEAAVILGRLTSMFGVVTVEDIDEEGLGFRAPMMVYPVGSDEPVAVAMIYDEYAEPRLCVMSLSEDEDETENIAREFWMLILDDLDDVEDEDVRVFNPEDGIWLCYGVADGDPFYDEEEGEEEDMLEFEEEPFDQEQYDGEEEEEY